MLIHQEKFNLTTNPIFTLSEEEQKSILSFFCTEKSELTVKEYKRSCLEFLGFISQDISRLSLVTRNHLIMYQKSLTDKGLSNLTILKRISAVSSLCKHLAHDGHIEKDLSYGLKRPKARVSKQTADLSDKEVKAVFDNLNTKSRSFTSHRAMLAIGFYTGLRSSEIRNLKMSNLSSLKGHRILALNIKGDKYHELPLSPFVYHCIEEHINFLRSIGINTDADDQILFPGLNPFSNKPMSPEALSKVFSKALERAGIVKSSVRRYSPHSMRATLAGHLLNTKSVPLEQVQKALGYSSPTTTQKYNKRKDSFEKSALYKVDF